MKTPLQKPSIAVPNSQKLLLGYQAPQPHSRPHKPVVGHQMRLRAETSKGLEQPIPPDPEKP
ncbi:hypothetical protein DY000_02006670 [Brassica cretica]|uniref:Uncharacterized protein n=1 Tax=Brassica cretica TaxID=69181 RepID=A0ABQ7BYV0_BRACR|nr:hypothetical protein DY000_02006670 [Brassica cretica]